MTKKIKEEIFPRFGLPKVIRIYGKTTLLPRKVRTWIRLGKITLCIQTPEFRQVKRIIKTLSLRTGIGD